MDPQDADPAGIRITYHVHKHPDAETRAAFNRGAVLHQQGDVEGARTAYQQAIDSGRPRIASKAAFNLGLMLVDLGDVQGTQAAFQKAVELGHPEDAPRAAFDLGILLRRQGDQDGARAAFQIAVDSGERDAAPKAALILGQILREQGDPSGAQALLQIALDSDDPGVASTAAVNLGVVFEEYGDQQNAALAYRKAVNCDDPRIAAIAAGNLGKLLAEQRPAEAELLLRRAADAEHAPTSHALGRLLEKQGRDDEAERCYRQAVEHDNGPAMTSLATLLIRRSQIGDRAQAGQMGVDPGTGASFAATGPADVLEASASERDLASSGAWLTPSEVVDEAEQFYRRAIDAGEMLALNRLGVLLADCGRLDEAEDYYRRAIDAGIAVAWGNLARLVMRRDPTAASGHGTHAEQVLDLLEHGAQAGDVEALIVLGTRAVERDDAADAERYFGQAAESGSTTAHVLLLIVVAGQGRPAQTQALVDQIVADDDQVALDTLERMTVFVGVPEVLAALRNTGSTRDPAAWHRVADLLAAMG